MITSMIRTIEIAITVIGIWFWMRDQSLWAWAALLFAIAMASHVAWAISMDRHAARMFGPRSRRKIPPGKWRF
jgi:hypothetical protein